MRIACLQFNPKIGQVEANVNKVWSLLLLSSKYDFVILPELAVTGYNFRDANHIRPYLESTDAPAASINLARQISHKYKCFTLIGYPELAGTKIYNLALLVSPSGSTIHNYRKSFLYSADETWGCSENPRRGFESFELILDKDYYLDFLPNKHYRSITTNIGICMDLNPYKFEAPFNSFEFSMACFHQQARLILCPMAWLLSESPSVESSSDDASFDASARVKQAQSYTKKLLTKLTLNNAASAPVFPLSETLFEASVPSFSTVNYWILRFFPFLCHENSIPEKYYNKVTVVACNRVGVEDDVVYGGSSSIFQFSNTDPSPEFNYLNKSVDILGSLGQGDEAIMVRDLSLDCEQPN